MNQHKEYKYLSKTKQHGEQIDEVGDKLRNLEDVLTADFVSKEDALNQMKEKFGDKKDLLAGYEENNIFPASYVVTLKDLGRSKEVQDQILTFDNIKKITSKDETVCHGRCLLEDENE